MRFVRVFLAVLITVPMVGRGQSATVTAKAFFQAHTEKQWPAMAEFVDSASLRALRGVADQIVANLATASNPQVRASMDSAGASGMVKAMDGLQSMLGGSMLPFMFARVNSADDLRAISDRELMSRWFEAKSLGYVAGLMSGTTLKSLMAGLPAAANSGIQSELDRMQSLVLAWDVIGEVADGDAMRHVAYRVAGSTPRGAAGVLTFVRGAGSRWYIAFTHPDEQLGHMAALSIAALQSAGK